LLTIHPLIQDLIEAAVWEDEGAHDPYRATLEVLHRFVSVQSISLLLYKGLHEQLILTSATDLQKPELPDERYNAEDSLSGDALQQNRIVLSNDVPNDPRTTRKWLAWWSERLRPTSLKHGVFVPIRGDLELQCVLRFFNRLLPDGDLSASGFVDRDTHVLELLAKLITVKLNEVWVADRLKNLSESISALLSRTTVEDVGTATARIAIDLANAAAAVVFLPDPLEPSFLRTSGSFGFPRSLDGVRVPIDRSLMGRAAKQGAMVEVEDLQSALDAFPSGPGKREGMASFMALPLAPKPVGITPSRKGVKPLPLPGILVVYSRRKREFHRSTRNLLQQFAFSAGSVIDNRRLSQEAYGLRDTLSLAAHSVRSPLHRVSLALYEMRQKDQDVEKFTDEIQTAFDNLDLANVRLRRMLHSQQKLVAATGLDISGVDVYQLIAKCVSRHVPIPKGKEIDLRDDVKGLGTIKADRDMLDLVFDNLIENAIKYSWRRQVIVISGERAGDHVRISVTDKGLGVPENMREKIFDSVVRSDVLDREHHTRGTGLGLYVSKLIVDAHGGTIRVKSVPFLADPERRLAYEGYETTFTVSLPIQRTT
jgi:signal transduction histidine kinase